MPYWEETSGQTDSQMEGLSAFETAISCRRHSRLDQRGLLHEKTAGDIDKDEHNPSGAAHGHFSTRPKLSPTSH